ncbi:BCCT family transporter [Ruminococcus gauvreauii]|uniref:BCCT family transporter n=1 Tax=Ruminococcus gauvreauii TaxID=438033 RepID=A0ABY5VEP8_9FIRM|nr:BCCT family transporter [Ruminococcus gauvreauii]UWP58401.1 BCCT family transporter [Ruminococcus gauvreauii]
MEDKNRRIDWGITIVPLVVIAALSALLMCFPERAQSVVGFLKNIFVNELGFFYIILGLAIILIAVGLAFSRYGSIRLGNTEKPRYSTFSWGAMIFTSTMAADILYWSLIEWCYYYTATPFAMENMTLAQRQDWASAYPLFHWGPIPWGFYILPACAYAYMMFVKNRKRQTLSEACRPILKQRSDKLPGRVIDMIAVVGLLAGTATTFSLATPLLSAAIGRVFSVETSEITSIIILLVIGVVFIFAVMKGMKAISHLATICVVIFAVLLGIFFLFGPKIYIIETGISAIGNVVNNFFHMSTWMDPLRLSGSGGTGFPQDWTIFYWAYWIAWFVATPFFIARISEGRTIKQTILGGLSCGLLGTYLSFIVFGGFGLHVQTTGKADLAGMLAGGASPAEVILKVFDQLPVTRIALVVLILAMIAFYASTFDAITLVVAGYSEKDLTGEKEPRKKLRAFWSCVFLLLPIALLFSESTLSNLQTISIIAAFPLGIIMILIVWGFFRELRGHWKIRKEDMEK